MIKRIVKMNFKKEAIEDFKCLFLAHKDDIRSFEGCLSLSLLQDLEDNSTFFTYSYWKSEQLLDSYRQSDLFHSIWSKTKILFNQRPQAWSVKEIS